MWRISTGFLTLVSLLLAGCSGGGKQELDCGPKPDNVGCCNECTCSEEGWACTGILCDCWTPPADVPEVGPELPDVVPGPDCGPYPENAGWCNECWCKESGWECTQMACIEDILPGSDVQNRNECCTSDDDCTSALTCVIAVPGEPGTCEYKTSLGYCYSDADCDPFYECEGEQLCTCNEACDTEGGHCVPTAEPCCSVDGDCPEGTRCVGAVDGQEGVCLVLPAKAWHCWTDSDCPEGEVCGGAKWAPCGEQAGVTPDMGYCKEASMQACIEQHSGCGCEPGCVDGFSTLLYYPEEYGPFDEAISPPAELLAVALAMYECGICDCTEAWKVPMNGEWVHFEGDVEGFCLHLFEMDEACGGCLVSWWGGCC